VDRAVDHRLGSELAASEELGRQARKAMDSVFPMTTTVGTGRGVEDLLDLAPVAPEEETRDLGVELVGRGHAPATGSAGL